MRFTSLLALALLSVVSCGNSSSDSAAGKKQIGEACTTGGECEHGLCVGPPSETPGYCSVLCASPDACPKPGYYCTGTNPSLSYCAQCEPSSPPETGCP